MSAPIAKPWLFSQSDQDPRSATGQHAAVGRDRHRRHRPVGVAGPGPACRRRALRRQFPRRRTTADSVRRRATVSRKAYGDDDGVPGYQRLLADDAGGRGLRRHAARTAPRDCARLALNAGKHVLCEKAFTINAREAAELVGACPGTGSSS